MYISNTNRPFGVGWGGVEWTGPGSDKTTGTGEGLQILPREWREEGRYLGRKEELEETHLEPRPSALIGILKKNEFWIILIRSFLVDRNRRGEMRVQKM